jgi:hypothetical protein
MQLNKIGTHVKNGFQNFTGKMFGIIPINKTHKMKLKPCRSSNQKFNNPNNIVKEALLKAEIRKSQAVMFARRCQNR